VTVAVLNRKLFSPFCPEPTKSPFQTETCSPFPIQTDRVPLFGQFDTSSTGRDIYNLTMSYDPAYDKGQFQGQPVGMSPVVSAQPVPAYAIQSQTVAAQPVTQQTGQYGQYGQYPAAATPAHQNAPNIHAFSQRPPPGRWGDSICDWPKNLFPSCYCACCCCYGMWLASQSKE
jgi:hypothetical protein